MCIPPTFRLVYDWPSVAEYIENEKRSFRKSEADALATLEVVVIFGIVFPIGVLLRYPSAWSVLCAGFSIGIAVSLQLMIELVFKGRYRLMIHGQTEWKNAPEDSISVDSQTLRLHQGDPTRLEAIREITDDKLDSIGLKNLGMAFLLIQTPMGSNIMSRSIALLWWGADGMHNLIMPQEFFISPIEQLLDALAGKGIEVLVVVSNLNPRETIEDLKHLAIHEKPVKLSFHQEYVPGKEYSLPECSTEKEIEGESRP